MQLNHRLPIIDNNLHNAASNENAQLNILATLHLKWNRCGTQLDAPGTRLNHKIETLAILLVAQQPAPIPFGIARLDRRHDIDGGTIA